MPLDAAIKSQGHARWFALQTLPRHEKRVRERLEYSGIHCFLPIYTKSNRWKNGCTALIEFPLFPSYMFVEITVQECGRLLVDPGVTRVIGAGRNPVAIPESEIQALQHAMRVGSLQPHDYLAAGQKVRIKKGPLLDLTGVLVRIDSNFRVVLTSNLIRQGASVEVDFDDVEVLASTIS
ncbi:MAG TPA: transcription termination/antitermination NusG family protein [Candidatus Acidoferrales bacterium]|jgi:transcription antitermination factor NusG|nr:transcription termination/antitermination NusG family protein [Candidatus Acidoferrales bacterium]